MTGSSQPSAPAAAPRESALAPLRGPRFRAVWLALLGSQIVVWMNTVGAVTVIADRSDSPTLLALVQTASSVPAVLLALFTGAIADIVDRRHFALASQTWMLAAVGALAALTLTDVITAPLALALTFALGAGMATTFVIYQAITPDFVSRDGLPGAVALNGVAINLARAVGPAVAGLLIAAVSAGFLFAVEAALLIGIIGVVLLQVRPPAREAGSAERLAPALRAGMRFMRFSRTVRSMLVRTGSFSICAGALWALLPVVALGRLDLGSSGFGVLMGCVGAGAILGASVLPRLRARVSLDVLIAGGSLGLALGLLALAYLPSAPLVGVALLLTGACWISVLSSLSTAAQVAAPGWVRARTLSMFQLVMQGGLAGGSLAWGLLTGASDVETALSVAAAGLVVGVAGARRWPLARAEIADLTPAGTWSDPSVQLEPAPTDGPVLVTVEYRVDPDDAAPFVDAMEELGRVRRRDGAYRWNLYRDLDDVERFLETFVVDSWEEHLRQHGRLTVADLELEERAKSWHRGDEPPAVTHMLYARAALRLSPALLPHDEERPDDEQHDAQHPRS